MSEENVSVENKVEVIICDRCLGLGKIQDRISWNDYKYKICPQCDGKGRLIKKTKITTFKMD